MLKRLIDWVNRCSNCNGKGILVQYRHTNDSIMIDGHLREVAEVVKREICKKCEGKGKKWLV